MMTASTTSSSSTTTNSIPPRSRADVLCLMEPLVPRSPSPAGSFSSIGSISEGSSSNESGGKQSRKQIRAAAMSSRQAKFKPYSSSSVSPKPSLLLKSKLLAMKKQELKRSPLYQENELIGYKGNLGVANDSWDVIKDNNDKKNAKNSMMTGMGDGDTNRKISRHLLQVLWSDDFSSNTNNFQQSNNRHRGSTLKRSRDIWKGNQANASWKDEVVGRNSSLRFSQHFLDTMRQEFGATARHTEDDQENPPLVDPSTLKNTTANTTTTMIDRLLSETASFCRAQILQEQEAGW